LNSAGRDGQPSRKARPSVSGAFSALADYEVT